jgi:molybdenum cofactor cytidylyltransferase
MNAISAIVLAAGESRRMGAANKLLMPVAGIPALRRVLDTLTAAGRQETVVVLGHQRELVAPLLDGLDVRAVFNERFRDGQMTSVWAGMSALSCPCDGVMICLGDQPLLTPSDIAALIAAFAEIGDRSILVPTYQGQRGNPIILSYKHHDSILAGGRNLGCKHLIERNPELVATFAAPTDHFVLDIDTPEAYEAVLARVV